MKILIFASCLFVMLFHLFALVVLLLFLKKDKNCDLLLFLEIHHIYLVTITFTYLECHKFVHIQILINMIIWNEVWI